MTHADTATTRTPAVPPYPDASIVAFVRHPLVLGSFAGLWALALLAWAVGFRLWTGWEVACVVSVSVLLSAAQCFVGLAIGWRLAGSVHQITAPFLAAAALIGVAWLYPVILDYTFPVANTSPLRRLYELPNEFATQVVFAAIGLHGRRLLNRQHNRVVLTQLAARLARTRTQSYQARLQPAFVLDSLNTIADRISVDPADADRLLLEVSGLLRQSIRRLEVGWVPLEVELDHLTTYHDVARDVYNGQGTLGFHVDRNARRVPVPSGSVSALFNCLHAHPSSPFAHDVLLSAVLQGDRLLVEIAYLDDRREGPPGARAGNFRVDEFIVSDMEVSFNLSVAGEGYVSMDVPLNRTNTVSDGNASQSALHGRET